MILKTQKMQEIFGEKINPFTTTPWPASECMNIYNHNDNARARE